MQWMRLNVITDNVIKLVMEVRLGYAQIDKVVQFSASVIKKLGCIYSQTCVQRPPLGPENRGRYAEGYMKKISGQ